VDLPGQGVEVVEVEAVEVEAVEVLLFSTYFLDMFLS
jgi:hypothetical protein